jgi:dihydroxyacetone kinase DhaKLM complex PTS-EIIA-like component DhaM
MMIERSTIITLVYKFTSGFYQIFALLMGAIKLRLHLFRMIKPSQELNRRSIIMNLKKLAIVVMAVGAVGMGVVSAQPRNPGDGRPGDRGLGSGALLRDVAEIVSDATGLTTRELRAQILEGTTLAEIITENGGDVDAVTEDIVAAVTEQINQALENERITQEQADELLADLETRVTDALNGETLLGRDGRNERDERGGRGGRGGAPRPGLLIQGALPLLDAVTDATGLSLVEIGNQIGEGATLAEVVTNNGGDVDEVIAAAVAAATEQANQAVANGRITQEQADELLARLETLYQNAMEGRGVDLRGMI